MPVYRCPCCKIEPRASEKTKPEGDNIVRTIVYECGTVLKVIQNNFRFKHQITKSEKCVESRLVKI